jgi:amino acid adenylation domain-containing protein
MSDYLLPHLLTAAADRHPERDAVVMGDQRLSYSQMEAEANRLAHALRGRGVGRGDRVALWLRKSPRAVVAIHGVMKAGAAYVPVDPGAPPARAAFILRDCSVAGLVTESRLAEKLEGEPLGESLRGTWLVDDEVDLPETSGRASWAAVEAEPPSPLALSGIDADPAYILYTSGSTGEPKGVVISHRNSLAFVEWAGDEFGVRPEDRLANHAPFHFDLSIFDLFAAARAGAAVYPLPPRLAAFPAAISKYYADHRLSIWYEVPSSLILLLTKGGLADLDLSPVRVVLFAGEVFPPKYLRQLMALLPRVRFANLYGPTETNVCTWYGVGRAPEGDDPVPIGVPCANTEALILDEKRSPVPDGEVGELWVRGPTVMLGYWGRPERSREVLVPLEAVPGSRDPAYFTGDLVRRRPAGNLEFLGRRDHQVKTRGYRVELGEIESVLSRHEAIAEVVVLAIPDPELTHRLVAVAVARTGQQVHPGDLKRVCAALLPAYMVPETVEMLPDLPRTSSGKVDRRALAARYSGA